MSQEPDQPGQQDQPEEPNGDTARESERRRRRARVFGDVLPEVTRDERGDAPGERGESTDEWLRRQVPPHHG